MKEFFWANNIIEKQLKLLEVEYLVTDLISDAVLSNNYQIKLGFKVHQGKPKSTTTVPSHNQKKRKKKRNKEKKPVLHSCLYRYQCCNECNLDILYRCSTDTI